MSATRGGAGGGMAETRRAGVPAVLDLARFAAELSSSGTPPEESWVPVHVQLEPDGREAFLALCRRHGIRVLDPIDRQLADLAAVRLPGADSAARRRFVDARVAGAGGLDAYGVWVWLPWKSCIVHVLAPDDFFDVVTDRNRDKITREEQRRLRARRVGILGLSVGGEAAVTVAQEHLAGEIVLADFDTLDLSNLNRLAAGIEDIGRNKAVLVARRIAAIDPFLPVTIFPEGVTATSMDAFLEGLDLLIEECDGLAIKYEVRKRARERRLNVVYAADERGFLSVEPYADQRELPVFHGRVAGPPAPREAQPAPLAFMRALTEWLGGWEHISPRSRATIERVGVDVCGYPQLASEARFAAGQIGHVARRLLLGDRLLPFVGHLDLDEMIPTR